MIRLRPAPRNARARCCAAATVDYGWQWTTARSFTRNPERQNFLQTICRMKSCNRLSKMAKRRVVDYLSRRRGLSREEWSRFKILPRQTVCRNGRNARWRAMKKDNLWFGKGGEIGIFHERTFRIAFQIAPVMNDYLLAKARMVDFGFAPVRNFSNWILKMARQKKSARSIPIWRMRKPTVLLEDSGGGLWIGTSDSGLFYFNGTNFETVSTSHREILSLFEDREGNLWTGTARRIGSNSSPRHHSRKCRERIAV